LVARRDDKENVTGGSIASEGGTARNEFQTSNLRFQIRTLQTQKRPLEGVPRRLPLLQPIRLFRILN
jgi:hypothetical protein